VAASMAAPGTVKYDGSHKLEQISFGGGGIGLNPWTRMAEIGQLADLQELRLLTAISPLITGEGANLSNNLAFRVQRCPTKHMAIGNVTIVSNLVANVLNKIRIV